METSDLNNNLLKWFKKNKQDMPWRDAPNIYHIWLSEIMLQQPQVKTVIPYYNKWLKKLPTITDVANTSEDKILKLWEGLGYYSRALNFHYACKTIVNDYEGKIPKDDFIKLKGVGKYINAAVQSIGYNKNIPTIDGNVNRVVSRLICLDKDPLKSYDLIYEYLKKHISEKNPGYFNQALMDLGRNICKPKTPLCSNCPITKYCQAYQNNNIHNYPIRNKPKKIPHYYISVGVIWKNEKILITKRKTGGLLGGLWEFPGGRRKQNESSEDCLIREIYEETNLRVELKEFITKINHRYSHFSISLDAFHCLYRKGLAETNDSSRLKWILPEHIKQFAFPKANHKFMDKIPMKNPWK